MIYDTLATCSQLVAKQPRRYYRKPQPFQVGKHNTVQRKGLTCIICATLRSKGNCMATAVDKCGASFAQVW